jgi:hypothetical protein
LRGGILIEKLRFENSQDDLIGELEVALEYYRDLEFSPSRLILTGKDGDLRGLTIVSGTEHQISEVVDKGMQAKFIRDGKIIESQSYKVRIQRRGLQMALLTIDLNVAVGANEALHGTEVVFESAAFDVPHTLVVDVPY